MRRLLNHLASIGIGLLLWVLIYGAVLSVGGK
jgi:hypothetical protein